MAERVYIANTGACSPVLKQFNRMKVTLCCDNVGTPITGKSGSTRMYSVSSGRAVYLSDDQVQAI